MYPSQLELLQHIMDECNYLERELKIVSEEEFYNSERIKKAFVKSLEIIGEACSKIHPDFKTTHSQTEWHLMSGMRNRLVHEYFGIDYETVWETVKSHIPNLKEWIEVYIEEEQRRN